MENLINKNEIWTARQFSKKIANNIDIKLLLTVISLTTIGLLSLYSATFETNIVYFTRQLIFSIIGFGIVFLTVMIPMKWIRFNSIFFYIASIVFLVAVLLVGKTVSGTKGWLVMGGLSFQPAEFAKIATLLMVGRFLSQKGIDIKNLRDFLMALVSFFIPIGLILWQPDVGSSTVLLFLLIGIMFWTGFDLFLLYFLIFIPATVVLSLFGIWYFIGVFTIFFVSTILFKRNLLLSLSTIIFIFVVGYFAENILHIMPRNTQDRIEVFMDPESDPLDKGYNVMQSVLAVGSGGLTGKGFMKGSQTQLRYIPEQRTDFIFCVTTEEFGFIGGALVVLLYTYLIFRILVIASQAQSDFLSIVAFGIGVVFFYHTIINLGMVVRLVPIMGIPLPFMSYGGTALLVNMFMVGVLMLAHKNRRKRYNNI